ncbi:MAG: hypothetical protein ACW99U_19360 [Candidatus Thorarchaeota archaeon]|jgi:hypothetical protein
MFNNFTELQRVVDGQRVDLGQLELLMIFIFSGFTIESEFAVISGDPASNISKSEALRLKAKLLELFEGKPKSLLRILLPAVLLGIVNFAIQKQKGVDIENRLASFTNFIRTLSVKRTSSSRTQSLRQMSTLLDLPYYRVGLNALLDPFASFFGGSAPDSFTKANAEFRTVLAQQKQLSVTPSTPPTRSERPTVELVPTNTPVHTKLPDRDPKTVYRILIGRKEITITDEQLIYFGTALSAGSVLSYLITRKRMRRLQ